jgi:hypothetical protein
LFFFGSLTASFFRRRERGTSTGSNYTPGWRGTCWRPPPWPAWERSRHWKQSALEGGAFGTFEHVIGVGDTNWSPANYEINGIDPGVTDPAELLAAWKENVGGFFPEIMARMHALPVTQKHLTYEFTARPPGQEPRRVHSSVFIERNSRGHPTRFVGITRRLDQPVPPLP